MNIVLDIDGTIADNSHRVHFIDTPGKPKDWDEFLAPSAVYKDAPIKGVQEALYDFQQKNMTLIIITGRHERLRDTTMRWLLEKYNLAVRDDLLIMRPEGNMMKAHECKREQWLSVSAVLDRTQPSVFFDDDPDALAMYREFGLALEAPKCWEVLGYCGR